MLAKEGALTLWRNLEARLKVACTMEACSGGSRPPPLKGREALGQSHLFLGVPGDTSPLILLNAVGPEVSQVLRAIPAPKQVHGLCRDEISQVKASLHVPARPDASVDIGPPD